MFKHILVPTDGSALSGVAFAKAALLARLLKAKLTAIHVTGQYHHVIDSEGFQMPEITTLRQRFTEEEAARAKQIFEEARKIATDLRVDCACVTAHSDLPYQAILDEAARSGCDLIVMASHGRRGVEGILIGSETQKVLTHGKIPVLVCR